MNGKREYGDYQTPLSFARRICDYLSNVKDVKPVTVIEPTCGIGNFLESSLSFGAQEYIGIEINDEYSAECRNRLDDPRISIITKDFFRVNPRELVTKTGSILVIGNPPWVTSSTLSSLASDNLPQKSNIKRLKGIDAITGASNFDICEYIILQLVEAFHGTDTVIAMLCKTSVARNVFTEITRRKIAYSEYEIVEFNSEQVFHINAAACLLFIRLSQDSIYGNACIIRDIECVEKVQYSIVCTDGKLQRVVENDEDDFEGVCCFEWRQGVKHDCSQVMELTQQDGLLFNARNELVEIENDLVYPLVKSSMFKAPVKSQFTKYVIVTQKRTNESTYGLANSLPLTWSYLQRNAELFARRKSSIYRNAPPFSMFGVGRYTFSPYKVGVSGFYKEPMFSLLYTEEGRPVMTDDTSYFICFDTYDLAYVAMLILNNTRVQRFLSRITFSDSKRPYTKKALQRIDFHKIVQKLSFEELKQTETDLRLSDYMKKSMFEFFVDFVAQKINISEEQQLTMFALN